MIQQRQIDVLINKGVDAYEFYQLGLQEKLNVVNAKIERGGFNQVGLNNITSLQLALQHAIRAGR